MSYTVPPNADAITRAANLLDALARDRAKYARAPKLDALLQRYRVLRPQIRASIEPWDLAAQAEAKLHKPAGWRPTKAERAQIKDGTFVLNPTVTIPQPDPGWLMAEIVKLIRDFPPYVLAEIRFATRVSNLLKEHKE